jgi:hypothetical protein
MSDDDHGRDKGATSCGWCDCEGCDDCVHTDDNVCGCRTQDENDRATDDRIAAIQAHVDDAVQRATTDLRVQHWSAYLVVMEERDGARNRLRAETAIAKDLLRRNVELGTRADNAEAACDDLRVLLAAANERADTAEARLAEIGDEWQVRYKLTAGRYAHTEWTEPTRHEASARSWLAGFLRNNPGSSGTLMHRRRGEWRDAAADGGDAEAGEASQETDV